MKAETSKKTSGFNEKAPRPKPTLFEYKSRPLKVKGVPKYPRAGARGSPDAGGPPLPAPDVASFNVVIDMWGKDHRLDRALAATRRLQGALGRDSPDARTLTALAYACLRCGQPARVATLLARAERERWASGRDVGDSADATAAFAVRLAVAQAAVEEEVAMRSFSTDGALSHPGSANADRAVEDAFVAIRELEGREGGVGTAAADALIVASIRLNVSAMGWAFAREQFQAAASEGGVSGARAARAREGRGAQGATSHKLSVSPRGRLASALVE